ncbi:splicing factor 3B subunit 2-like isoform X2 [Dreissena polymorpha]|uniref:SAP domain-containing protein n=1 Tax=Dreissena polymorpha TaxID=45954 RepID=A0A9D4L8W3_DREPO|nr:splicing factor 3B subunit 2-like isoform X2 [Dreissena polymorpha]KAH3853443.1 hypothetical protein DPMN_095967 [Dreissena polymorpha]
MATPGTPELTDLRKLTVVKLRERLTQLGLPTSGLKADLVERLHAHYQEEANTDNNQQDEEEDYEDDPGPPRQSGPPSLLSIHTQEPQRGLASSQGQEGGAHYPAPGLGARTSLQMRLQQMAGHSDDAGASSQPPPAPMATRQSAPQPPPLLSKQIPPPAPVRMPQVPMGGPPSMAPPGDSHYQPPPPGLGLPQGVRPPMQPPQPQAPVQHMPQPQQMRQMSGPPGMSSPPSGMSGPPAGMGGPPSIMGGPLQGMGGPPQQMGGPLQGMGGPPQQMGGPLPGMGGPPPGMGGPPQQMGGPPPGMGGPPPGMGGPPMGGIPPPGMSAPPLRPLMHPQQQGPEMHDQMAMQNRMMEQERQQQQRQQQQQHEERMAIQQQALLMQQQQQQQPLMSGDGEEKKEDLMEKVRQQQIMLEQQKHKEMLEQQQQAIKKQEEDRKRKEQEILRQQQMARQSEEQRNRGPPKAPGGPFNPNPTMPSGAGPRPLLSSTPGNIPPLLPGLSSTSKIPPLLPPSEMSRSRDDRGPSQGEPREMKLPSALEKVLAFKDVRAQEVGMTEEEIEQMNMPEKKAKEEEDDEIEMVEMEDQEEEEDTIQALSSKESKNKRRKKKKKKARKNRLTQQTAPSDLESADPDVQIEYVQEQLDLDPTDPNYFTFSKIFEAFKITDESARDALKQAEVAPEKPAEPAKKVHDPDADDSDEEMEKKADDDGPKLSKKKLKKLTRLSVAQLKQLVTRPDVVEMHDVTAQDPKLLVHLKATRNSVPVPRHWCFKRKYLQGKRGIEKAPFELPEYIQATGITEMRAALAEKEDQKNLKAKMREKVRPKMGKIDIDYQKLHDAFFRWQVKPKMTIHGDLYYEGKEFETRLKEKKPGNLSDDLKTALGMPIGPQSEKVPPPWLIAMQRYGPPPSYPSLKIPGLNAPIPEACSFGYHAGGWGKPPVDENGKPLYGDVFGTKSAEFETQVKDDDIDRSHWGELESESESEEESESESEEEGPDETGLVTPAEGLVTPSGMTSVPLGMETPDMIELRKKRIEDSMDQGGETPALYQVIPEKKTTVGGAMMGSAHIYDISGVPGGPPRKPGEKVSSEGIEVALNPEELDLDTAAMQAKYDQTLKEQQSQLEKEDLSDMVAEHAAKQKKRKKKQEESGKAAKKYKEFKF